MGEVKCLSVSLMFQITLEEKTEKCGTQRVNSGLWTQKFVLNTEALISDEYTNVY
jgi:hypothetical protein